jgi:hypothetical protein
MAIKASSNAASARLMRTAKRAQGTLLKHIGQLAGGKLLKSGDGAGDPAENTQSV